MKKTTLVSAFLALALISCKSEKTATPVTEVTAKPRTEQKVDDTAKTFNAVCPISGEKVAVDGGSVLHKGKKIGFCCSGCIQKFQADPEKYLKNISPDGQKWISKDPGEM